MSPCNSCRSKNKIKGRLSKGSYISCYAPTSLCSVTLCLEMYLQKFCFWGVTDNVHWKKGSFLLFHLLHFSHKVWSCSESLWETDAFQWLLSLTVAPCCTLTIRGITPTFYMGGSVRHIFDQEVLKLKLKYLSQQDFLFSILTHVFKANFSTQ